MNNIVMTDHGIQRTKERVGLKKKLADKNAQKAFEFGLTHADTKAGLKRYLNKLYLSYQSANNIRVYHRCVYLFSGNKLITVFTLPQKFYSLADKLQQQKDGACA